MAKRLFERALETAVPAARVLSRPDHLRRASAPVIPAALLHSLSRSAQNILALQRTLGNRFVANLLTSKTEDAAGVQAKLTVGHPDDEYEREADRVARQVTSMNGPGESVMTKCAAYEKDEAESVRKSESNAKKPGASATDTGGLEQRLLATKGMGHRLSDEARAFMEPRFGNDFGSVTVHNDTAAVQLSRDFNARAFTHGSDIYFGAGESPTNYNLLAHELTHVVQQNGASPAETVQRDLAVPPTVRTPAVAALAPAAIQDAIHFNQALYTNADEISLLRDIVGISPNPPVIDESFIRAIASYQASYGLPQDGKITPSTRTLLAREVTAEATTLGPGHLGTLAIEFRLKNDLQALINAGNSTYADYKAKVTAATPMQKNVALLDTTFLTALKGVLAWNDFARCVELLGRSIPAFADLTADASVRATLNGAWTDSTPAVPGPGTTQHEEGGWVFMNLITGELSTQRAARGAGAAINLAAPPAAADSIVVAKFHTHPNLGPDWVAGPSPQDATVDAAHGVPDIVCGTTGVDPAHFDTFLSGPDHRAHLAGNQGLPGAAGGIAPQAKRDLSHDEQ